MYILRNSKCIVHQSVLRILLIKTQPTNLFAHVLPICVLTKHCFARIKFSYGIIEKYSRPLISLNYVICLKIQYNNFWKIKGLNWFKSVGWSRIPVSYYAILICNFIVRLHLFLSLNIIYSHFRWIYWIFYVCIYQKNLHIFLLNVWLNYFRFKNVVSNFNTRIS